jgi:hypothetical protein
VIYSRLSQDPIGRIRSALQDKPYDASAPYTSAPEVGELIADIAAHTHQQLLICLDQFEEVFRYLPEERRLTLMSALAAAVQKDNVSVILALRSDYDDLLTRLCRSADPSGSALNVGNFYELHAFSERQTQAALDDMFLPLRDDPIVGQSLEDFSDELVAQLLRAPRDRRVYQEGRMSVLPVELQIMGFAIESLGPEYFSVSKLRALGGKKELFRSYVDQAVAYAWRRTGVDKDTILLILNQLIRAGVQTGAETAGSVSARLGKPAAEIGAVLRAFTEQYLVTPLPSATPDQEKYEKYEFIHEYIGYILSEAKDPALIRAQEAEERLRFWVERSSVTQQTLPPSEWARKCRAVLVFFRHPIPITEVITLWKYAPPGVARNALVESGRGLLASLVLLAGVFTGLFFLATRSSVFNVYKAMLTAPASEVAVAASSPEQSRNESEEERFEGDEDYRVILGWVTQNARAGRTTAARNTALLISDGYLRANALAEIAYICAEAHRSDCVARLVQESAAVAAKVKSLDLKAVVLAKAAAALFKIGNISEGEARASKAAEIGKQSESAYALAQVGSALARADVTRASTAWDAAFDVALNVKHFFYQYYGFAQVSKVRLEAGDPRMPYAFLDALARLNSDADRCSAITDLEEVAGKLHRGDVVQTLSSKLMEYLQHQRYTRTGLDLKVSEALPESPHGNSLGVPAESAALEAAFGRPGADEMLARTTLALARGGKGGESQKFYDYTIEAIKPRGGPRDYGAGVDLLKIAAALAVAGHAPEALDILRTKDRMANLDLYRLASVVALAGEPSLGLSVLDQMKEVSGLDRDLYWSDVYGSAAIGFATKDNSKAALETAGKISRLDVKGSTLATICSLFASSAVKYWRAGKRVQSRHDFEVALNIAESVGAFEFRSRALASVAAAYASVGDLRKAVWLSESCTPTQKLMAYSEVVSHYYGIPDHQSSQNETIDPMHLVR